MKIYNSLSGKKENLPQPKNQLLRLFVCGPTVYDFAHIGHARTYIFFDIFTKYLRKRGLKLKYVQNITNIDDKIINRAREEKKDPLDLAHYFTKRYLEDMKSLGVTAVDVYAPATNFIPQIVRQVQTLIKKGYAYEIPGDGWYYDVSRFNDYGKLSRRTQKQAEDALSRIDESVNKKNRADFCLWKYAKRAPSAAVPATRISQAEYKMKIIKGEPAWQTELGWGRPGWHIEDTAISEKFFGPQYEIHGGGLDLKFPHHEAEIAQQEAASGKKPFVKIWMHTGLVNIEGKKMAKSLKNFVTVRDFLKKHSPALLRLLVLKHHYRLPINYTEKLVAQAEKEILSMVEFLEKLRLTEKRGKITKGSSIKKLLAATEKKFHRAMADDLNTPKALAAFFELMRMLQNKIWRLGRKETKEVRYLIESLLKTLGLTLTRPTIPKQIRALIRQREMLRVNKQFVQADALRKKILALGYKVEDTPLGPLVLKND